MEQQILKLIPKLQLRIGEMRVAFIKIMMMQSQTQVSCLQSSFLTSKINNNVVTLGCKEGQFYSLPFGQGVATSTV